MDTYLYKYNCKGKIWGHHEGLRNFNVDSSMNENNVIELAKEFESSVFKTECSITLLQKYRVSIENMKNYSAITSIPLNISVNDSVNENKTKIHV
tara:strand:+ start:293 stop:577 length:285 start_codon:yes stop_codon:yes gene_type:complete